MIRRTMSRSDGADKGREERPVIIVSVGRSGSTLLHEVFTRHPDVAWLTALAGSHPSHPRLQSLFLRGVGVPLLGGFLRRRWGPAEVYEFWERYARGFGSPFRNLRAEDLTPRARRDILAALDAIRTPRRRRLLLKITGWPRITYLKSLFPEACFVHIVRDGRAVANSALQTPWWRGWQGPTGWRFGELSVEDRREWEAHEQSFLVLAALQWRFVLRSIEDDLGRLRMSDYCQVRYEDLCAAPVEECRRIASFCGLSWTTRFDRAVRGHAFENTNAKFTRDLSADQVGEVESVLHSVLVRYGYL